MRAHQQEIHVPPSENGEQEVCRQPEEERHDTGSSVGRAVAEHPGVPRVRVGRHRGRFGRHHDESSLHALYATQFL